MSPKYADPVPTIITKRWSELTTDDFFDLVQLRAEVFIRGQKITDEPEVDEVDRYDSTLHVWIPREGADADPEGRSPGALAYLRITGTTAMDTDFPDVFRSFGRVAVHPEARGRGLAQELVAWVVERHGHEPMLIHAQAYIEALYQRFGFERIGELYEEANIPHYRMLRPATPVL